MQTTKRSIINAGIVLLMLGFMMMQGTRVFAQSSEIDKAKAYFKGKNIQFIVPFKPGGGYDLYARMIAPFLEKQLHATVVVQNVPGGGGLLGVNKLYSARSNGLTIGMINMVGAIMSQVGQMKGVSFKLEEFGWLGRVVAEPQVLLAGAKSPLSSIEDIKKMTEPLKYGTVGPGAFDYLSGLLISRAFDFPIKMVSGYSSSSEYDMAMLKGEVDCVMGSLSSKIALVQSGDAKAIILLGKKRAKELPDLPIVSEIKGLNEEKRKLVNAAINLMESGRAVAAPPNLPKERLQLLQDAWNAATADPELLQIAEKTARPISNLPGPEMLELVSELITRIPKPMMDLIKDSYYKM